MDSGTWEERVGNPRLTQLKQGLPPDPLGLFVADPSIAYNLGRPHCAGEYGGLNLKFTKNVRTFSDVKSSLSTIPWTKRNFGFIPGGEQTT